MKKIFENFYLLSKLSLSIFLIFCVFFLLYIIYINYQKEDNISKKQINIEQNLEKSITKNTEKIKNISKEITQTKSSLIEIEKLINSIEKNQDNTVIVKVNENIQSLTNNLNLLTKEIENLKKNFLNFENTNMDSQLQIINKSKSQVIDLILLKYQNNLSFDEELNYLENILNYNELHKLEKIYILKKNKYRGHNYLQELFNEEVNSFLKLNINENSNSMFSKIFLPYIKISPTSENVIEDNLILKIKEISFNITNKNIEKAFENIILINNYENYFKLSLSEMNNYINFKNAIYGIR